MSHRHDPGSPECREIFARLSEYLDQELDPALCEQLVRHNEDCPPCQKFLESLQRTVDLIRDPQTTPLPASAKRAIMSEYAEIRGTLGQLDDGQDD